jgi:hemerythrin-like domain-containing protein
MKATEILSSEHRIIEQFLDTLDLAAGKLQKDEPLRAGFFLDAADFIKEFADGCHHHKEEGVLFVALIKNGMPADSGPIGVMFHEHDQGRMFTRKMVEATQRFATGDQSARKEIIQNALGYTALLRQHIAKEDSILFPAAGGVIPPSQQDQVWQDFQRIEIEETGVGVHEKYHALAEALEEEIRGEPVHANPGHHQR